MRRTNILSLLLAVVAAAALPLSAQQTIPVTVTVGKTSPAQPVPSVRVSISYLDSGQPVAESPKITAHDGTASLVVSPTASQRGGNIRLQLTSEDKNFKLAIYKPADGQLPALPNQIDIILLPLGSAELLSAPQIEAMLNRLITQVNSLKQQNRVQKQELSDAKSQPQKQDLDEALAEWARLNGFTPAEANIKVQQWGQATEQASDATCQQKALAQLALKNNEAAAAQFTQCFQTQLASLDDDEKAFLDARRQKLTNILSTAQKAAGADQLAAHYHQATAALEQVTAVTEAEFKKHPDDKGFH